VCDSAWPTHTQRNLWSNRCPIYDGAGTGITEVRGRIIQLPSRFCFKEAVVFRPFRARIAIYNPYDAMFTSVHADITSRNR
jgi:hypothetical protein